ncbi:MAG TPA: helix-turn-helix domain-containing protein [bacterium]|nr:helix-turn-helix domain-containing protein [bacterium]
MSDRILSVKEAAAYCLVSPETIRRWIKKEELPAFNTRGKGVIKIRKEDLDAFVKKNNILIDPQVLGK